MTEKNQVILVRMPKNIGWKTLYGEF